MSRVREAAEKAKCDLSSAETATISLPYISFEQGKEPKHLNLTVTRKEFDEITKPLIDRTEKPLAQCLRDAGIPKHKVDEVLLVGGSTRIPKVSKMLEKFFDGKKPNKGVNPDEAVALGAAV
jgi:molecular chaperone DnaK